MDQTFSIMLISSELADHGNTFILFFFMYAFVLADTCGLALSCWKSFRQRHEAGNKLNIDGKFASSISIYFDEFILSS